MTIPSKVDITIACVPPDMFGKVWTHAGHMLLAGFAAAENVPVLASMDACRHGKMQLWLIIGDGKELLGVFLTQITESPEDGRWVALFALAGREMWSWTKLVARRMDEFASAEKATGWRFAGREGWKRAVPGSRVLDEIKPGVFLFERVAQ